MKTYLGIDYGDVRTGLATGNDGAKIASPLTTVKTLDFFESLASILQSQRIAEFVVGRPLGLEGEGTQQSQIIDKFVESLKVFDLPISIQNEDGTSAQAEEELQKSKRPYSKEDIDMYSATILLQDYLDTL